MNFATRNVDGVLVVVIAAGMFDTMRGAENVGPGYPELREQFSGVIAESQLPVLLDIQSAGFVNARVLNLLFQLSRIVSDEGRAFAICGSIHNKEIWDCCKVERAGPFFVELQSALRWFDQQSPIADTPSKEPDVDATVDYTAISTAVTPTAPRMLGRYELREELGQGAFGVVYKAFDPTLQREVALKIPKFAAERSDLQQRFLREAQSAAGLRHPNIVTVHDFGADGTQSWIAMELVTGQTLADWQKTQRLSHRETALCVRDLALALQHAHELGVLHRDLKPANVLIDVNRRVRLTDFGLSKELSLLPEAESTAVDDAVTQHGDVVGTPAYMSPEQARGDVTSVGKPSDIYGLGVILYELLAGRRPFAGNAVEVLLQAANPQSHPLAPREVDPTIPIGLEAVALKAMAKDPAARYAFAADLAVDLQRWLRGDPVLAPLRLSEGWVRVCSECNLSNAPNRQSCQYCGCDLRQINPVDTADIVRPRQHIATLSFSERTERWIEAGLGGWLLWGAAVILLLGFFATDLWQYSAVYCLPGQWRVESWDYQLNAEQLTEQQARYAEPSPPFSLQNWLQGYNPFGIFGWGLTIGMVLASSFALIILAATDMKLFLSVLSVARWAAILPFALLALAHEANYSYVQRGFFDLSVVATSRSGRPLKSVRLDYTSLRKRMDRTPEPVILGGNERISNSTVADDAVRGRFGGSYYVRRSPLGRMQHCDANSGGSFQLSGNSGEQVIWVTATYSDGQPGECPCLLDFGGGHDHMSVEIPYAQFARQGPVTLSVTFP